MSFAPPKSKRKNSPGSPSRGQEKRSSYIESPAYSTGMPTKNRFTIDNDIGNRLEIIESNLSRISQQQDALLPLMNMIDLSSILAKNENAIKILNKKSSEMDDRIIKIEHSFKTFQMNIDQSVAKFSNQKQHGPDLSLVEKNLKGIINQINDHNIALKELENNFANFEKTLDGRLKEETSLIQRQMDIKFEKYKQDTSNIVLELRNNTQNSLRKFDDILRDISLKTEKINDFMIINNKQKIFEEINEMLNSKFQEHYEFIREKYDKDIDNVLRDIGIIRSEIDLINEEKRQLKINPYLQNLPKDVEPTEKKIKINNIEQALNLHELEKFNKDNTQRIAYELQGFDDKLDNLKNQILNLKSKNKPNEKMVNGINMNNNEDLNKLKEDMELVYDRYINLKYQIEGVKKKYLFDMKRIEDKMEKILQIKREAAEEMISNPKTKRIIPQEMIVIESFPEKIKSLMEAINGNLEFTFTRLELVEEKIKENQDLIKRY